MQQEAFGNALLDWKKDLRQYEGTETATGSQDLLMSAAFQKLELAFTAEPNGQLMREGIYTFLAADLVGTFTEKNAEGGQKIEQSVAQELVQSMADFKTFVAEVLKLPKKDCPKEVAAKLEKLAKDSEERRTWLVFLTYFICFH